ncbi:MAG: hypothetical protein HOF14_08865 [Deltaproteobacteria bacterium]|nr:hypothetical protein [Deltaproteobacteria bacterium]MBT5487407.1 hypothetical protein [Deltaproteobacteria bacterium]MBT7810293.1 hypothetical protein [Deltaproteobacteria bacterium]
MLAAAVIYVFCTKAEAVRIDDSTPLWCGENISDYSGIPSVELTRLLLTEL